MLQRLYTWAMNITVILFQKVTQRPFKLVKTLDMVEPVRI